MKGIDYRLLRTFLVVVVLVIATNYNYIFGKKKTVEAEPAPGPAPGPAPSPAPETPEEEEEEEEETLIIPPKVKPGGVKTTVNAEVRMIETLPPGIVKKEGYIGYSHI
jgi:hypothetical protein